MHLAGGPEEAQALQAVQQQQPHPRLKMRHRGFKPCSRRM